MVDGSIDHSGLATFDEDISCHLLVTVMISVAISFSLRSEFPRSEKLASLLYKFCLRQWQQVDYTSIIYS